MADQRAEEVGEQEAREVAEKAWLAFKGRASYGRCLSAARCAIAAVGARIDRTATNGED
jgi:hypothetical protein